MATAAFEIKAEIINVTAYKIEITAFTCITGLSAIEVLKFIIKSLIYLAAPVFSMAIPAGISKAIRNITDQFIEL